MKLSDDVYTEIKRLNSESVSPVSLRKAIRSVIRAVAETKRNQPIASTRTMEQRIAIKRRKARKQLDGRF